MINSLSATRPTAQTMFLELWAIGCPLRYAAPRAIPLRLLPLQTHPLTLLPYQ